MNKYTVTISGYFKVVEVIEAESTKEAKDEAFMKLSDNGKMIFVHDQVEVVNVTEDASLLPLS